MREGYFMILLRAEGVILVIGLLLSIFAGGCGLMPIQNPGKESRVDPGFPAVNAGPPGQWRFNRGDLSVSTLAASERLRLGIGLVQSTDGARLLYWEPECWPQDASPDRQDYAFYAVSKDRVGKPERLFSLKDLDAGQWWFDSPVPRAFWSGTGKGVYVVIYEQRVPVKLFYYDLEARTSKMLDEGGKTGSVFVNLFDYRHEPIGSIPGTELLLVQEVRDSGARGPEGLIFKLIDLAIYEPTGGLSCGIQYGHRNDSN